MLISFNRFLQDYGLYLALGVAALIIIVALAILFPYYLKRKKGKPAPRLIDKTAYVTALGGAENILSKELKGSRIVLRLADNSKVDKEKLKEAGVDGFILMSDKLTLVLKGDAEAAYKTIFGE